MFNANDALRYPASSRERGLRRLMAFLSGMHEVDVRVVPPLPTQRPAVDAAPRHSNRREGLAATDNLERLGLSQALPEDVPGSRALVGMSREEPDISPHISTLDVGGSGRFTATHASRHGWEICHRERMDYAARLEDDVAQMQNALDRAYTYGITTRKRPHE
ncbi:putative NUP-1 protein [Trypanosoma cruzi]|nr:putative NUP-1 protein [Trypanosoma cruzi]